MPRLTKYESKIQEVIFKFLIVPFIFVLGIYLISDFISHQIGSDVFKWFLFVAGTLTSLALYFKKHLQEINW